MAGDDMPSSGRNVVWRGVERGEAMVAMEVKSGRTIAGECFAGLLVGPPVTARAERVTLFGGQRTVRQK